MHPKPCARKTARRRPQGSPLAGASIWNSIQVRKPGAAAPLVMQSSRLASRKVVQHVNDIIDLPMAGELLERVGERVFRRLAFLSIASAACCSCAVKVRV